MSSTIKQAILSLKSRIANAYEAVETKGGTLPATQDTANLPAAIASIPEGGGGEEPEEKDVLFIDYDGTIIASYTYEEFESVTDYPTPPEHEGLNFVGWTNTIQELKDNPKKITLSGALYCSSDNRYHIIIKTFAPNQTFSFQANVLQIYDWGDGTGGETSASGSHSHTYASEGRYDIALGANTAPLILYVPELNCLQMVIGLIANSYSSEHHAMINQTGLYNAPNLEFIVAPAYAPLMSGNDNLGGCRNLKALVGYDLKGVHRSLRYSGIKYAASVKPLQGQQNFMDGCSCLRRVNWNNTNPTVVTNCSCLQYIVFNDAINSLSGCRSMREVHIKSSTSTIPSLPNTNYFANVPTTCKIYVKTGLLSQYETATNWSTIYSQYQFIEED